jgi:HK97 gp10 family phage protein
MSITSGFQWFGAALTKTVLGDIDAKLQLTGQQIVATAQSLAPVRTGALRAGIDSQVANHVLTITFAEPYSLFQEFGTRTIPAHPYIRPALNAVNRVWGGTIDVEFNVPLITAPVVTHKGTMIVPSGIQPRPLTQAQHRRVQANAAVAKQHYRGNVKRAGFRVKRF